MLNEKIIHKKGVFPEVRNHNQMRSVTDKVETLRKATAQSCIAMKSETIERVKANDLPKKDVFAMARVAGVMAAKKTSDLIPYCHPIPLDSVEIEFELEKYLIEKSFVSWHKHPLSALAILGYMLAKQAEVRNIKTISK